MKTDEEFRKVCGDVDIARYERDNAERDAQTAHEIAAMEIKGLKRCVARWQNGDLIESDFVTEDGGTVGDPYAEVERLREALGMIARNGEDWTRGWIVDRAENALRIEMDKTENSSFEEKVDATVAETLADHARATDNAILAHRASQLPGRGIDEKTRANIRELVATMENEKNSAASPTNEKPGIEEQVEIWKSEFGAVIDEAIGDGEGITSILLPDEDKGKWMDKHFPYWQDGLTGTDAGHWAEPDMAKVLELIPHLSTEQMAGIIHNRMTKREPVNPIPAGDCQHELSGFTGYIIMGKCEEMFCQDCRTHWLRKL